MKQLSLLIFLFLSHTLSAQIHHQLNVEISPLKNFIKVLDQITFEHHDCNNELRFNLHAGMNPKLLNPKTSVLTYQTIKKSDNSDLAIEEYSLNLPCTTNIIELSYEGIIFHPVTESDDPYSRGTSDSPGLISNEGVVLSSSTFWYPQFLNTSELLNFDLKIKSTDDFTYMSQGQKIIENYFIENTPQEEIYIIGAKFNLYVKENSEKMKISAYLRSPDEVLATKYLDATDDYLKRYSALIGPYPYKKFDLVENFWDTGFGMPSFTLLGSNIIRLPFIINTSYPHEILHDWWGNSVYVDYERGNWCEGITAYMADHLMAEINNSGDTYRRDSLQKFTDFVTVKNDFPLNKFLNRYNASTEAIGYGKALMFFHMLRNKLGDEMFKKGFEHFYLKNIFKKVSYSEIKESLEIVSGLDLSLDFNQWVNRVSAPDIKIIEAKSTATPNGFNLNISIEQVQNAAAFNLEIPIAISLENETQAKQIKVLMNSKKSTLNLNFDKRPIFLQVDPEFDVMRIISNDEVPAVMTMPLGAKETYFILPSKATSLELASWNSFIDTMKLAISKDSQIIIAKDTDLKIIPKNASVWILSSINIFKNEMNALLKKQNSEILNDKINLNSIDYLLNENSFTIVDRDPINNSTLTFVSSHDLTSITTLANKLVHYGKYSYLAFNGDKLINKLKGVWKLANSSMSIPINQDDGKATISKPAKLLPRGPLAN